MAKYYRESTVRALIEQHNSELRSIHENVKDIPVINKRMAGVEEKVAEIAVDVTIMKKKMSSMNKDVGTMKSDIKSMKGDINSVNHKLDRKADDNQVTGHEQRISTLEEKVFSPR